MEPMIIYIAAYEGDLIKITAAEFEKYIKQAYEAGLADGKKQVHVDNSPIIMPLPYKPFPTFNEPVWREYQVTCGNNEFNTVTSRIVMDYCIGE